jgi:hypothetical protein
MKSFFALLLGVIFTFTVAHGQSRIDSSLLVGKWKFVKFELPDGWSDTAGLIDKANKEFKGAIYNFTEDKRMLITQPNGPKSPGNLKYSINGVKVYVKQPGAPKSATQVIVIKILDKKQLKFSVEGSEAVGIFQRISE